MWKSRLKVERFEVLFFSVFYVVGGISEALILVLSRFELIPVGLLGVFSVVTAYGLIKMKRWSVFLTMALFFPNMTFSLTTLYSSIRRQTSSQVAGASLLNLTLIVYAILCFSSFVYVVARRRDFS